MIYNSDKNPITKEFILSKIPQVELDPEGTFKYVLIKCQIDGQEPFYLVRGY